MDKLIDDLLKKGLGNFIGRSRDALIWDDEVYQKCSREEDRPSPTNPGLSKFVSSPKTMDLFP